MRPNGLSQSSLILLLTLGVSILAHAAVLLWGNSDAETTKLPGQRLQIQVSVASKPPAAPEAESPDTPSEPVVQSTQPVPDITPPIEKPPEKPPLPQPKRSKAPVGALSPKPAPVTQSAEKVMAPVPVATAQVKPEPSVPVAQFEPEQSVAKVDKPVPLAKPDPAKQQVIKPSVEPVAESEDRSSTEAPTPADTEMESSQTQQASFQAAQVRKQTKPHYPRLARRRGQEGTVWLRVQVDSSGKALAIEIDRSSGFEVLDKAAIKAVRSWHFLPALQDGQAQASYVKIPVKFQLDNAR